MTEKIKDMKGDGGKKQMKGRMKEWKEKTLIQWMDQTMNQRTNE